MTIKHVLDQLEELCLKISIDSYDLGMKEVIKIMKGGKTTPADDLSDKLREIVKNKLEIK